jgi:radical SAM-linked protein
VPDAVRFRFAKLGKVRFTSHRDLARMWERGLRRSGLPLAWSQGFSPRLSISFGLALPTGCESVAEYLDVHLPEPGAAGWGLDVAGGPDGVGTAELCARLSSLLPDGVDVTAAQAVAGGGGSLQQEVTSCSWELEVLGLAAGELAGRVERFLDAPSVLVQRERKGRLDEDDLRPAVRSLSVVGPASSGPDGAPGSHLQAELATHPRGVRPAELITGLGADLVLRRACRTQQWIEREGRRWEPLVVTGATGGADAPHARRAS